VHLAYLMTIWYIFCLLGTVLGSCIKKNLAALVSVRIKRGGGRGTPSEVVRMRRVDFHENGNASPTTKRNEFRAIGSCVSSSAQGCQIFLGI
jgi:hypothetical protein